MKKRQKYRKKTVYKLRINLKKIREERGMSISDLARAADTSVTQISNIENKKRYPSVTLCMRLVKELGLTLDEFFGFTSKK